MTTLNNRERELVALGASLASNCIPCVKYHIQEARKAELTDEEISEAIEFAEKIKRVPAGKVLETASDLLSVRIGESAAGTGSCCTPGTEAKSCC
jgi:4-carboxymuconolactone decarboxylase